MTLCFIIMGENTWVEDLDEDEPLFRWRDRALALGHHTGRSPTEWEIRDATGKQLDPWQTTTDLELPDGARLFLSLRVGVGGAQYKRNVRPSRVCCA